MLSILLTISGFIIHQGINVLCVSSDFPCQDATWKYSPVSGYCYKIITESKTYTDAESLCSNILTASSTLQAHLVEFYDAEIDRSGLCYIITQLDEVIWIGAKRGNDGNFTWKISKSIVSNQLWHDTPGTQDCTTFKCRPEKALHYWNFQYSMKTADCAEKMGVICSHKAQSCSLNKLPFPFDPLKMRLQSSVTHVALPTNVVCKPGFYRDSERPNAKIRSQDYYNVANCTGVRSATGDPQAYKADWEGSIKIESCRPISCDPTSLVSDTPITDTNPYEMLVSRKPYEFDAGFTVTCRTGYVSVENKNSNEVRISCGQDPNDKGLGKWMPWDLYACKPVECPDFFNLNISNPSEIELFRAYNRQTNQKYTIAQRNSFPYYPNRVDARCKSAGYFFANRKEELTIQCNLQANTTTQGAWHGVDGTALEDFRKPCIPVKCLTSEILVSKKENSNDQDAEVLHFLNNVTLTNFEENETQFSHLSSGVNVTIKKLFAEESYTWQTTATFYCISNFSFRMNNGKITIRCEAHGGWDQRVPKCIQNTESIDTGFKKHYEPEPREAKQAGSVGALVIIILVIVFGLIVVLDLSTLSRDLKVLKRNLSHMRNNCARKSKP